jgi:hypothetical protein
MAQLGDTEPERPPYNAGFQDVVYERRLLQTTGGTGAEYREPGRSLYEEAAPRTGRAVRRRKIVALLKCVRSNLDTGKA